MSVYNDLAGLRKAVMGERVTKATAALPQSTTEDLFTVTGGRVMVLQIIGEVTTVIETQANDTKISHDPDEGAAADLCGVLDVSADAKGTCYTITGAVGDAMLGGSHAYGIAQANPLILPAGTITLTCAASNTGSVKWDVLYIPIDDGAAIASA